MSNGEMAVLTIKDTTKNSKLAEVKASFNPESLKLNYANEVGGKENSKQAAKVPKTKLEISLIFDTTEDGKDVRGSGTQTLREMAKPDAKKKAAPTLNIVWGNFSFIGTIESLNESLEFWSHEGIPLRSTVQLSLQSTVDVELKADVLNKSVVVKPLPKGSLGTTALAQQAGAKSGDTKPARDVAEQNGMENMRAPSGGNVAVGGGVELKAAAGFSASASLGASIGFGFGAQAGGGAGVGLGGGIGASAGAGFGASASAGFGASAGAGFGASASAGFGASAGASFGAGGAASFGGGALGSAGASFGASAGFEANASFGASASIGGSASGFSSSSSSYAVAGSSLSMGSLSASEGAFSGLSTSTSGSSSFNFSTDDLLPPPRPALPGPNASFSESGTLVSGGSGGLQANVSGSASASVKVF